MRTRAIIFNGRSQAHVREVEIPSPESGEVIVQLKSTVISPGTELRCWKGTQRGLPEGPFIPGYTGAGHVMESGLGMESWSGKRVLIRATLAASVALCWGGHIGHAVVREEGLFELPDSVDLVTAPVCRLFAIAHRGLVLSRPSPGAVVGVVGLGVIGQCSARLFHAAGCEVVGVDPIRQRVDVLIRAGVQGLVVSGSASETLLDRYPMGVDILVDATGSEAVLNDSVSALKRKAWNDAVTPSGQVVIQGSYADRFEMEYGAFFVPEATVHFPRDTTDADVKEVLRLMGSGEIAYSDLVTWTGQPDEAQQVYQRLADRDPGLLTGAFLWS